MPSQRGKLVVQRPRDSDRWQTRAALARCAHPGPQNCLVMSGSIAGQELVVNFVRDAYNNVHQIWLLTALEATQKIKPATPASNVLFESDGTKAKVDDGKTPFDQLPKYKQ